MESTIRAGPVVYDGIHFVCSLSCADVLFCCCHTLCNNLSCLASLNSNFMTFLNALLGPIMQRYY